MIYWFIGILLLIAVLIAVLGYFYSSPAYKGPVTDHFNGKKFSNLSGVRAKNFLDIIKWAVNRNEGEWTDESESQVYSSKPADSVKDGIAITFINHASFLIQVKDRNILTDPIYSKRASPFSLIGPKRMRQPGIKMDDLPEVHIVLISHNHYDHLDLPTLIKLKKKDNPVFIVPLGVKKFFQQKGFDKVIELDWWEKNDIEKLKITFVPAQHFSSRSIFDKDKTLWGGFVIQSGYKTIYFAGDTGYGEFFKDIGKQFKIDLALLPIGAFEPRWVMKDIHLNAEEAVQVYKDIGAESAIGMHFGTFPLADDGQYEAENDLAKILKRPENERIKFRVLREGEGMMF